MPYKDRNQYLANQKLYYEKRKEEDTVGQKKVQKQKQCAVCSFFFTPKLKTQKYCKPACKTEADAAKNYQLSWRKNNPEKVDAQNLRVRLKRYGLTEEQFKRMEDEQNGNCKICGINKKDARKGELCVDHCHDTLKVRGLLCHVCNSALGLFKDDPELIKKAFKYVKNEGKIL